MSRPRGPPTADCSLPDHRDGHEPQRLFTHDLDNRGNAPQRCLLAAPLVKRDDPERTPRSRLLATPLRGDRTPRLSHGTATKAISRASDASSRVERHVALAGSRSDETAWRGLGRALPSDSANPGGYYEREDVVRLNYATISSVTGAGWTSFRSDHLLRRAALDAITC